MSVIEECIQDVQLWMLKLNGDKTKLLVLNARLLNESCLKKTVKNCYAYLTCDQAYLFSFDAGKGGRDKKEARYIYLTSPLAPLCCSPVIN